MTISADAYDLTIADLAGRPWTVVSIHELGHSPELTLESGATATELRHAVVSHRLRCPHGAVVVVVAPHAPAELVIAALSEGADACVRGFDPSVVRAHISAIYRRHNERGPLVPS